MSTLPSFTKLYWATWFGAFALYVVSMTVVSRSVALGWFGVIVGFGSAYVFHFEFGRLMGFLRANCPVEFARLRQMRFLESVAFVHPGLIRRMWGVHASPVEARAYSIYRAAWSFTLISLLAVLVLANTMQ
jgi:hypothetical protein